MENKVFLEGRMADCSFYKAKNQVRCDILVDYLNENSGHIHKFKIRGTGEQAVIMLISHYPGRAFRLEGFLRGSSKGRTVIIADSMSYDSDDISVGVIMSTISAKMVTLHMVLEPSEKETNAEFSEGVKNSVIQMHETDKIFKKNLSHLHLIDGDGKVVKDESFDDESEVKEDRDESEPVSMSEALDIVETEIKENQVEEEILSDEIAEVSQSEAPLVEADSPPVEEVPKESRHEYLKRQNRDGMEAEDHIERINEDQVQDENEQELKDHATEEERTEQEDESYDQY